MPWPLVVVGIFMGFALIMLQVRSPMLFAVGMYLAAGDHVRHLPRGRRPLGHGQASRPPRLQRRSESARGERRRAHGSGLIAGEALTGLLIALSF